MLFRHSQHSRQSRPSTSTTSRARMRRPKPGGVVVAVCAILATLLAGIQSQGQARTPTAAAAGGPNWSYASAKSGTMPAGTHRTLKTAAAASSSSSAHLTPQQLAQRRAAAAKLAKLPAPKPQHIAPPPHTASSPGPAITLAKPQGAQQQLPQYQNPPGGSQADADAVIEKNVNLGAAGAICATDCFASSEDELSVAGNGKYLFATGDFFAGYSMDGGASWSAVDPYALDPNFAGNQQVIYEPARNIFLWELETFDFGSGTNGVDLVIASGNIAGTCEYRITSLNIDMAANQVLDLPDLQFGTDDTYLTWNTYDPTGATWENSALLRIPTDALANLSGCSGFSDQYLTRSDVFGFTLVSGSTEALNFASQWCVSACTAGSQMMFYNWAESATSYGILKLSINPFPFEKLGDGNCASQDGLVTNWCGYADSSRGTSYVSRSGYRGFGGQVIGFAWNAAANPAAGYPFPYVVRNYFVLPTMAYKGSDAIYSNNDGVQYPGCADTPYRGYVACTVAMGGGTGMGGSANDLYPSTIGLVEDKQHPTQPWDGYTLCWGGGNPGTGVWGRFTTTREWSDHLQWLQGNWCMYNNVATTTPAFAIVGLQRDHNAYLAWNDR